MKFDMKDPYLFPLLFAFLNSFENKPVKKLQQRDDTKAQEEPKKPTNRADKVNIGHPLRLDILFKKNR